MTLTNVEMKIIKIIAVCRDQAQILDNFHLFSFSESCRAYSILDEIVVLFRAKPVVAFVPKCRGYLRNITLLNW